MGTISAGFSMSLDGFIAGPNDDVQRVYAWMSLGNTDLKLSSGDTDFDLKVSSKSADFFKETINQTGAIISGRRMFDVAGAWGGKHPLGAPDIAHQCLKLGLLDEIHIDLVPVLLGQGVRLFERLGIEPVELERTGVIESPGVTHLSFRVIK